MKVMEDLFGETGRALECRLNTFSFYSHVRESNEDVSCKHSATKEIGLSETSSESLGMDSSSLFNLHPTAEYPRGTKTE